MSIRALARSFRCALRGFAECVRLERNFRIHIVAAICAVLLAVYLKLPSGEFAVLFLAIGGVMALELLNTAVEAWTDLLSPGIHPLARRAKDVAAGAVLVAAGVSVLIGCCLFWKPAQLMLLWLDVTGSPAKMLLLAGAVFLALLFIFGPNTQQKNKQENE